MKHHMIALGAAVALSMAGAVASFAAASAVAAVLSAAGRARPAR